MILNDLAVQRLIITEQKKDLFGKKIQARITDSGSKILSFNKKELEEKARDLENMYTNRARKGMKLFIDDNRTWIPMMIFSGIMSAMVFASMMSFMEMAMNTAEASVTEMQQTPMHTAQQTLNRRQLMIIAARAALEKILVLQSSPALIPAVTIWE